MLPSLLPLLLLACCPSQAARNVTQISRPRPVPTPAPTQPPWSELLANATNATLQLYDYAKEREVKPKLKLAAKVAAATYGVFAFGRRLVSLIRSFGQKAYVENASNQPVTWSVYSWGLRTPWTPARFHAPAGSNVSVVSFGWGPMYLKPNNTGRALRIDRGSAAVFDAPRPQTMRSLLASDAAPALRVVEPFPWRLWAAATLAMTLVAAFALLAYYRPSAAKRLFKQAVTAAVAVAKAIVDAVTVAAPPPPPPTPSPVASEHPESLTF